MTTPTYFVSTFTEEFFHGNPAAVVMLDGARDNGWYARVAAVLNQPATAFLHPVSTGFALRWFSPTVEMPLCGHGTVAAAHVLYESGAAAPDETVALSTQSGVLTVRTEAGIRWIELSASPVKEAPAPTEVLAALGLTDVGWYGEGDSDVVVVVDSVAAVETVRPDTERLLALPRTRTIVTAAGGDGVDFTSRVFPPSVGVAEDQVTGTAHAALGPYWSGRLGRSRLTARQASQRGGLLELDLSRDGVVSMGGAVTTIARGELLV